MADIEAIATDVVDCAIKVHKALEPGLLESAYQHCHVYELKKTRLGCADRNKTSLDI